jgi:hypothetical protein
MNDEFSHERIVRSAQAIKAYFEKKLHMPMEFLSEAPDRVGRCDVQFSHTMNHFGFWGVRASEPLASADHSEIYETFHSILEALEGLRRRQSDLSALENHLTQETPPNVIPLRRKAPTPAPSRSAFRDERRWQLRMDCLIEANYLSEIHKMAFELHTHSQRYAFVDYRDLDASKRVVRDELCSMGLITIYVPDILELSVNEQQALYEMMKTEISERPLLMVGTIIPYAELRQVEALEKGFLTALSHAFIKLTRPFSEYKDQGLIHYFLDSLSDNPS